jgi:hypothetical protein
VSITKNNQVIIFREILVVYFENNIKPINTLGRQYAEFLMWW